MSSAVVEVKSNIVKTPRLVQLASIFDVEITGESKIAWNVNIPHEEKPWNIGLIVGSSGCGKSTIASQMFGQPTINNWDNKSIVDNFPKEMGIKNITEHLSALGLSTIPTWLQPYNTLSMGEKFRADTALSFAKAKENELIVIDEWTSVVDRQVAKIASSATERFARKTNKRLVLISCHFDIIDWLQPDWIFEPQTEKFTWRCLRRRPEIKLSIHRIDKTAWKKFSRYHYLNSKLNGNEFFGAFVDEVCVAMIATGHVVHPSTKVKNMRKVKRLVVLPDWQGVGIGTKFLNEIGAFHAKNKQRCVITTAHPNLKNYLMKSKRWQLTYKGENIFDITKLDK